MTASQIVLEEAEENFNCPPLRVDEPNDLRWHVNKIGRDPLDTIAAWSGRCALVLAATGGHCGVEHVPQHKHAILVVVQVSLISFVSPALVVVQLLQQRLKHFEILQSLDILALELGFFAGRIGI